MEKAVAVAKDDLAGVRTGRANPNMFARIVDRLLRRDDPAQPDGHDQRAGGADGRHQAVRRQPAQALEKAIRDSDLGVNPSNDGQIIRVVFPQLTEERRREMVKIARGKGEDARVTIRNIRRKAMEELHRIAKDGEAGEDEVGAGREGAAGHHRPLRRTRSTTWSSTRKPSCSKSEPVTASSPTAPPRSCPRCAGRRAPGATCRRRSRSASGWARSSSARCCSSGTCSSPCSRCRRGRHLGAAPARCAAAPGIAVPLPIAAGRRAGHGLAGLAVRAAPGWPSRSPAPRWPAALADAGRGRAYLRDVAAGDLHRRLRAAVLLVRDAAGGRRRTAPAGSLTFLLWWSPPTSAATPPACCPASTRWRRRSARRSPGRASPARSSPAMVGGALCVALMLDDAVVAGCAARRRCWWSAPPSATSSSR